MKILVGTKNYSTWSLRPWLVLKHFKIEFEDEVLPMYGENWRDNFKKRTPAGLVPVLEVEKVQIGETLAIIEFLHETFPEKHIWPEDRWDRAKARCMASEMHAGFSQLRHYAPMNIRAAHPGRVPLAKVQKDLDRLEALLGSQLMATGGPFLFGPFSAADAMFAPVAMRIVTYALPVSDTLASWIDAIRELPAMQAWCADAAMDDGIVAEDEIDMMDN